MVLALLITACGPKSGDESTQSADLSPLEDIRILDTNPVGAISVKAARTELKPGDKAVVFGQIGGVDHPFLEGYAGFVLSDTDVVFCDEMGDDDHCPTPWDACCEDPDKVKASRASVQFVDAAGDIIATSIKGHGGLKELDEIVVVGTVGDLSTPENLIIEASGIYRESDNN